MSKINLTPLIDPFNFELPVDFGINQFNYPHANKKALICRLWAILLRVSGAMRLNTFLILFAILWILLNLSV